MLEPGDPGWPPAQLAGSFPGSQDHHGRPIGDRRAVVRPQRLGDVWPGKQFPQAADSPF